MRGQPGTGASAPSIYLYGEKRLKRRQMGGRLAKNAAWMLLGQGISFVAQAGYFILLARLLGARQYGVFVGAVAAVSLFSQYSTLGSGLVLVREVSRCNHQFSRYWGNSLITTLGAGCIVTLALSCFGKWMVGPASASIIVLVSFGECTCARLAEVAGQAFQAFEELKVNAVLTAITSLARLIAVTLMTVTLHRATVHQWAMASLVVSLVSAAVALTTVTIRLGAPQFDLVLLRKRWLEGVGFSIASSTTSVYNDIDKAMLTRAGMLAANGIYSMAYRVVDMSCTPIRALHSAAFPQFCQAGTQGACATMTLTRKLISKTLPFAMLSAVVMFVIAPLIPRVTGHSFSDSVSALRWLCMLPVLRSLHLGCGDALTGAGYQRYRTGAQMGAAGLNLGLNLWLIPAYSWHGAAWASLVTDGSLAAANWALLSVLRQRETGSRPLPSTAAVCTASNA